MTEQEKAEQFAALAPPLRTAELDAINGLFPAYIFRRSCTDEIWTTCCRQHLTGGYSDNGLRIPEADLRKVLLEPHQREPRYKRWDDIRKKTARPVCGKLAIVKELRYTGKRDNLSRYRRAVILRWYRGALWAMAYDCAKHYSKDKGYSLTGEPKYKLVGVYRFQPGLAEGTTRDWYWDQPFRQVDRQDGPLDKGHWHIHGPWNANAEYGMGYDVIGLEEIRKSPFRWCCAEEAERNITKFLEYLTACCFYPRQIEMLMKAGMSDVVLDLVERRVKHTAVLDWDAENPARAFRVSRQELKIFLGGKRDIRILELYKRLKGRVPMEECAEWMGKGLDLKGTFSAAKKWNLAPEKLTRYLAGYVGCPQNGGLTDLGVALQIWMDYLTAAEALNYQLHRENVLLPKKLGAAHNSATAKHRELMERERKKEQEERERMAALAYEERRKELERKYGFTLDGYVIRIPAGPEEIRAEGRNLEHCVGGYAARHMSGETTILFLRHAKKPDKPWLTIEMDGNRLRQIHGYRNEGMFTTAGRFAPDPAEVHKEFLDTWLDWLKRGSKRDKQGNPKLPGKKKGDAA